MEVLRTGAVVPETVGGRSLSLTDETAARGHRTVRRITTILEIVATSDGVRLTELARVLGAPKSSVHGLVKGLVAEDYLRELDGRYVLGAGIRSLVQWANPVLETAALPEMERLQRAFDETVIVTNLVGQSVINVVAIESSQLVRYSPPLHSRRPLYPTSSGKCFLAHMSEGRKASYLRASFSPEQRAAIEAELLQVREEGVGFNRGESLADISALASLIPTPDGAFVALALAGPSIRMVSVLEEAPEAVRAAAWAIGERLK